MVRSATGASGGQCRRDTRADRDWLDRRRDDVLTYAYRTACDAVRIGMILEEVRSRIGRGEFLAWVESELPFSRPTAHRYRQVAGAFGRFASVQFEQFDPCALYALAELSVPPSAREFAVQLAEGGERITRALALEILDAYREPDGGAAEGEEGEEELRPMRCLGVVKDEQTKEAVQCPTWIDTTAGWRFCARCRKKAEGDAPAKLMTAEMAQKRWQVVSDLATTCSEVRIARIEDHDDDEEELLFSVTCHREDDRPRNAVRRDLYDALSVLAGREETRFCSGCKSDVKVGLFGKNKKNAKGLMYRCKPCEHQRKAAMRAEAKLKRQEGLNYADDSRSVGGPQVGHASHRP